MLHKWKWKENIGLFKNLGQNLSYITEHKFYAQPIYLYVLSNYGSDTKLHTNINLECIVYQL